MLATVAARASGRTPGTGATAVATARQAGRDERAGADGRHLCRDARNSGAAQHATRDSHGRKPAVDGAGGRRDAVIVDSAEAPTDGDRSDAVAVVISGEASAKRPDAKQHEVRPENEHGPGREPDRDGKRVARECSGRVDGAGRTVTLA